MPNDRTNHTDAAPALPRDKTSCFCAETLSGWECCPIEQDGCDCPARRALNGESSPATDRPGIGRWSADPDAEDLADRLPGNPAASHDWGGQAL